MKMKKRISVILIMAAVMVLTLIPASASAESGIS